MTEYWGSTIHFFLLILYNFKNIWGGGGARTEPQKGHANQKVSNGSTAQTIKFRMSRLHKQ